MNAAVEASAPFVRFRVQRLLASGDRSSPEGRDRIIDQLRPVLATLPPSAMRLDLIRLVSDRLELPESLAQTLLAAAAIPAGSQAAAAQRRGAGPTTEQPVEGGARRPSVLTRREDTERAFLALCIASASEGQRFLDTLEPEEHLTSDLLRRAAAHLQKGNLGDPMHGVQDEPELGALLAELVVQARREPTSATLLEVQRQQLELAWLDRQIQAARAQGSGDVSELAKRRAEVKRAFDLAQERALQESGA